jgi:hypothetical protein
MKSRLVGGVCGRDAQSIKLWDELSGAGPTNFQHKPTPEAQASWDEAKDLFCSWCPIRELCAQQGATENHNIWGGLDQYERYRERKNRKPVPAPEPELAPTAAERPVTVITPPEAGSRRKRPFPPEDPSSLDGWTRSVSGGVRAGWYEAQSPDGKCIRMKLKTHGAGVIKWFEAEDVDLRRPVARVIGRCPHHNHETGEERGEALAS